MINVQQPERTIDGLQLVFIELPKFRAETVEPRLRRAWLRFLTTTGDAYTPEEVTELHDGRPPEAPEIGDALDLARESGFSLGELEAHDRYWDAVRVERPLMSGKYAEGLEKGLEKGIEKGQRGAIHMVLEARFGTLPDDFIGELGRASGTDRLSSLQRTAALCASLDEFMAALRSSV